METTHQAHPFSLSETAVEVTSYQTGWQRKENQLFLIYFLFFLSPIAQVTPRNSLLQDSSRSKWLMQLEANWTLTSMAVILCTPSPAGWEVMCPVIEVWMPQAGCHLGF